MEIHFLGVGEACDGNQPNTSMLLKTGGSENHGRILLDCGFSVPHRYFQVNSSPEELEILWISHFHGDHFMGTPLLLLRFWEEGRQKPLHILGPRSIATKIRAAVELAYPNLLARLNFALLFQEPEPGGPIKITDSIWQTAYNEHSQPCLSLRLDLQGISLFYSGDGRPTPDTKALAEGCDIIVHEAYGFEDSTPGHGSIAACVDFARQARVKRLALVHMQRDIRLQSTPTIADLQAKYPDMEIMLPEKDSIIKL